MRLCTTAKGTKSLHAAIKWKTLTLESSITVPLNMIIKPMKNALLIQVQYKLRRSFY
jgi:hypothetical protein